MPAPDATLPNMPRPDYDGGGIANLMASLREGLGGEPGACPPLTLLPPARVASGRNVLLLILDGLGAAYFQRHSRCLRDHLLGEITSVFPTATAPAITTFLTGVPPQQHAVTGWHMHLREVGTVTAILPFRARWGGPSLHSAGVPVEPIVPVGAFERQLAVDCTIISPHHITNAPFNVALGGASRRVGYSDTVGFFETMRREVSDSDGSRYFYAYWPGYDTVCHGHGTESEFAVAHFHELEARIAALIEALSGTDTLLLVTADHGFVDTEDHDVTRLEDHPELAAQLAQPLCGEPRAAFCHLKPGAAPAFDRYVEAELADRFECRKPPELLEEGWLGRGEEVAPQLLERLGDRVLIGREHRVIYDTLPGHKPVQHIGVHGGTAAEEMFVPLLAVDC